MANTILINTLIEGGVNTESRLVKVSCDSTGQLLIPFGLRHYPTWVQVIQAKETITGFPATARVYPRIAEDPPAPNGTQMGYMFSFDPVTLERSVSVYLAGPQQGTEIVHFTLHLGRTHSRAR